MVSERLAALDHSWPTAPRLLPPSSETTVRPDLLDRGGRPQASADLRDLSLGLLDRLRAGGLATRSFSLAMSAKCSGQARMISAKAVRDWVPRCAWTNHDR